MATSQKKTEESSGTERNTLHATSHPRNLREFIHLETWNQLMERNGFSDWMIETATDSVQNSNGLAQIKSTVAVPPIPITTGNWKNTSSGAMSLSSQKENIAVEMSKLRIAPLEKAARPA